MEVAPYILSEIAARKFIDYCKGQFGWSDLSKDEIMDVGCGEEGFCGKAILARFPNTAAVIGIDNNEEVVGNFEQKNQSKMQCKLGDILNRSTLQKYEGKISKVVSTEVFDKLQEKEEAFSNVYHLLKPGGEAAIFFVMKYPAHEWLTEMLKIPKWKNAFQGNYLQDIYSRESQEDKYREMVTGIGFQVVDCKEISDVITFSSYLCKEALYEMCGADFKLPTELIEEFKDEGVQVLLKVGERNEEGRPCYTSTELSLLLTKPESASGSKTNENPES